MARNLADPTVMHGFLHSGLVSHSSAFSHSLLCHPSPVSFFSLLFSIWLAYFDFNDALLTSLLLSMSPVLFFLPGCCCRRSSTQLPRNNLEKSTFALVWLDVTCVCVCFMLVGFCRLFRQKGQCVFIGFFEWSVTVTKSDGNNMGASVVATELRLMMIIIEYLCI